MIVSGKEIKESQDSLIIEKKEYPEVDFSAEENAGSIIVKTVKVCAEINTASGDIIWKHADGSQWLSQKKPELTETDVIHYNTGDEEPIINRVKTVDGERNFIQNLKAEKVRTAYRGKLFFTWKEDEEIHGLARQRKVFTITEVTASTYISITCVSRCRFWFPQKDMEFLLTAVHL